MTFYKFSVTVIKMKNINNDNKIKEMFKVCTSKTCESKKFPYCMEGCKSVEWRIIYE